MNRATLLSEIKETLTLDLEGMTCAACAARIERVISKNEYIESVSVNFPLKKAVVRYKTELNIDELIKKIGSIGYSANISSSEVESAQNYKNIFLVPFLSLGFSAGISQGFNTNNSLRAYVLGFIVIFVFGRRFHISAAKKIVHFEFNMDTLISLGSLSSVAVSLLPSANSDMFLDAGAYIISFVLFGKAVEEVSIQSSIDVSEAIKNSRPQNAKLLNNGNIEVKMVSDLSGGDLIGVSPGEIIPIDGVITSGSSSTNEDFLTGESIPVNKKTGDNVLAGSINLDGYIEVEVKDDAASTYDFIEKLILEAQSTTPAIQKNLDKVTQFFVPGILTLSLSSFVYRYFLLGNDLIRSLEVAISVLVIACPCALGLATPIVLYKASTLGYRDGFIFKNFDKLQNLKQLNKIIFDKTGTLTSGIFSIKKIDVGNSKLTEDIVLSYAASLEVKSNHPVAKSLLLEAEKRNLELFSSKNVKEVTGSGIHGSIHDTVISVFRKKDFENVLEITIDDEKAYIHLQEDMTVDKNLINKTKKYYDISILSGDSSEKVSLLADELGIENAFGDQTPEDKLEFVKNVQKTEGVIFIGDGVNDSPSLQQANVSITTSISSQIAQASSDIVIHEGGIEKILKIRNLALVSSKRVWQNLFLAFIYNTLMIPVAISGNISPKLGALAMAVSSISVVLNSSRKLVK
ncbi:cation-translocating P-type ATPase [Acidimicrobiia bacterium]|nr:cation-translocating P-type ATPase [Acidimicrobiia bacterium]MDA9275466.1 cation-translocating P-type ATPase [Acidimicrobiia bacterium]MDB4249595.1 cation-translocating P-type ATPase [Acidimicrobiia bacterium]MDC1070964.1 cation-translocating P-type ATPase [Acidimicrobiia bacterium]